MGVNSVILGGHVGQDPKIYIKGDLKIAKFGLGTTMFRNNARVTDWHSIEAFGKLAEYIEKYFKKGDYVIITGYLTTNVFKTKEGNDKKEITVKAITAEKPKSTDFTEDIPQKGSSTIEDVLPW
jgi:single-strand DNA-binding protein